MHRSSCGVSAHAPAGRLRGAVLILLLVTSQTARAQDPTFTFAAPVTGSADADWDATAQAGVNLSSGNTRTISLSGAASLSFTHRHHRFSGELSGSFARTRVELAADINAVGGIGPGEVQEIVQTTSAAWATKLRYDRFFGTRHSVYGAASALGDEPAGKRLLAGVQAGYSRELLRTADHTLWIEFGYDVAHESYVSGARPVTIHSARAFSGFQVKPYPAATALVGAELLTNLSPEHQAFGTVRPLEDNRLTARSELNFKINSNGQLALRLRARYNSSPAPRPPPPGTSWEPGYVPRADELDTATEIVFIYSLL